jgi:hypothetical protein
VENGAEIDLIYSYSREEAINDGVLVDVTNTAKEAGFICSVALTQSVNEAINEIPKGFEWQDEKGRLWDLINILFYSVRFNKNKSIITFKVLMPHCFYNNKGKKIIEDKLNLKCVAGPGDKGELVLTVMLPHES